MSAEFANSFAQEWVQAWNAHDLDRILSHYADDFEMTSPVIVDLLGEPSGALIGKAAVGAYWAKALAMLPDLHFELTAVYTGVNSVTITYQGARGRLSAEVFFFNAQGQVTKAVAHYG